VALIFNNSVEILSYPWEFFIFNDLIVEVISLVEKVLKTKYEEGEHNFVLDNNEK